MDISKYPIGCYLKYKHNNEPFGKVLKHINNENVWVDRVYYNVSYHIRTLDDNMVIDVARALNDLFKQQLSEVLSGS